MLFRRYGTFTGGIDLPDEKHATLNARIAPAPTPERLRVPLAPCGGRGAKPRVTVGDRVEAGSRIATAAGPDGLDILAPLSGKVAAVTTVDVARGGGFAPSPAVVLTELSDPQIPHPGEETFDWRDADAEELRSRIADGNLITHRRRPEPLTRWINRARSARCDTLIANVIERQPYVTAGHRLLAERGPEVTAGLAMLARAIEASEVLLAVDQRRTSDYRDVPAPAREHGISRVALPHKYPIGADNVLVKVLTRREVPPGGDTTDMGAAVIDAATCFAVRQWVACGVVATGRVVTVAGERASRPGNYYVAFGTVCEELAAPAAAPLIHGGPMMGLHCTPGTVVSPATDAVLAIDVPAPPPPGPCIRCGWCTDHCPARLNVAALNDAYELGQLARAARGEAPACVDCGVCSYVCPARLPLSQRVRQLKRTIDHIRQTMPLLTAQGRL